MPGMASQRVLLRVVWGVIGRYVRSLHTLHSEHMHRDQGISMHGSRGTHRMSRGNHTYRMWLALVLFTVCYHESYTQQLYPMTCT